MNPTNPDPSRPKQVDSPELPPPANRFATIPNLLCAVRLVGSAGLVVLAVAERPLAFLLLFLGLAATDWLDGKLAVWLNQRSTFGARLDSLADATMYAAVLFGGCWMRADVLRSEAPWIAAGLLSYAVSCGAALVKFRRLPSYHTRTAKSAWLFMVIAVLGLFGGWFIWPLRIAMLVVVLANLEATLITFLSHQYQTDVATFWQVLRSR